MRPSSLALNRWLLYCFIQGNRNCRTRWRGRYGDICPLCSHKTTMSNRRIRETKDMMQHTCHTRKGGEKSTLGSPDTEQTHGLSSGLAAVLSSSSPPKPWGPCGWEYGQLMKLKCLLRSSKPSPSPHSPKAPPSGGCPSSSPVGSSKAPPLLPSLQRGW